MVAALMEFPGDFILGSTYYEGEKIGSFRSTNEGDLFSLGGSKENFLKEGTTRLKTEE